MFTCRKRTTTLCFMFVAIYELARGDSENVSEATLQTEYPKILNVESQMDVISGSKLSLSCEGYKKLYWIFPDQTINSQEANISHWKSNDSYKSILEIKSVKYNHTGFYRCCLASRYLELCHTVYVFVNDEEHLFLPISDVVLVYPNSKSIIPCKPTFSNLSVTLWKRHRYLAPDDNLSFKPTEGFVVKNSTEHFSGFFWCKAAINKKEEKLMVEIYYEYADLQPPRISADGVIDIPKGSNIEIKCSGEERMYWTLPPNVLFFKESRRKDTGYPKEISVIIKSARVSDSGSFTCCYQGYDCRPTLTASNVFLRVNDPQNLYIPQVETVITKDLRCVPYVVPCVPSMPNVTVQLLFPTLDNSSNSAIDCQDDFFYIQTVGFAPNDIRKIRRVYNSGRFICRYIYQAAQIEEVKTFTSLDPSYSIEVSPSKADLFENDQIEITCQACKFAFRNIVWKTNDGKLVSSLSGVKLFDRSTKLELKKVLKFDSIGRRDAGSYQCVGITKDNFEGMEKVEVSVKAVDKPTIMETNMNGSTVTVNAGKKFELVCKARGEPQPKITWYWNNEALKESDLMASLEENNEKLVLVRVTKSRSGTYGCRAENNGGNISAELTVIASSVNQENSGRKEMRTENSQPSLNLAFIILCGLFSVGIFLSAFLIIRNVVKSKRYFR